MGDLARQRRARSLHVSQGHLAAAAVAVVLWTISSVAAGYIWGRSVGQPALVADAGPAVVEGPNEELDQALQALQASTGEPAFPAGAEGPLEPPGTPGGERADPLAADPVPRGAYTISLGQYDVEAARTMRSQLAGQGVDAWRAPVITGDQVSVRLAVGGFETEEAAVAEQVRIGETLTALGIRAAVVGMP